MFQYYWAEFVKRMRTIQVGLIFIVGFRFWVTDQTFGDAVGAFFYQLIWGAWSYGAIWQPVMIGNQEYEKKIAQNQRRLNDSIAKIGQGSRVGDHTQVETGYRELIQLFKESETGNDRLLTAALKNAEDYLKLPSEDKIAIQGDLEQFYGALARLDRALARNNVKEVDLAYHAVLDEYHNRGTNNPELKTLNAVSLMQFAKQHPPVFTKGNSVLSFGSNSIAASISAYWYSGFSVETFKDNVDWVAKIAKATVASAGLYWGTLKLQKLINRISSIRKNKNDKRNGGSDLGPNSGPCQQALTPVN